MVKLPPFDQWLAGISALGGLAGFVALAWEVRRGSRRRIKPDPSLLPLLLRLMEDFQEIRAYGGRAADWFTQPDRQQRGLLLAALNGAVVDDQLNQSIATARVEYLDCFAYSSASRPDEHVRLQLEAAGRGSASVTEAIERFNRLTRTTADL